MILIAAATSWEADPMVRDLGLVPSAPSVYTGRFGTRQLTLLKTGMGKPSTEKILSDWNGNRAPQIVISAGFAGAAQPGLRWGDIIADLRGVPSEWVEESQKAAERAGLPLSFGPIHSVDTVQSRAEKKQIGHVHRACAVDMESSALRSWAEAKKSLFLCAKVILDEMRDPLPSEIPQGEDATTLFRYGLSHIGSLPLLLKLYRRQNRGARRLSRFLRSLLQSESLNL